MFWYATNNDSALFTVDVTCNRIDPWLPSYCWGKRHKANSLHMPIFLFIFRYKDSKLAKMFNGTTPIILDTMKQHYFIDRDGQAFRHILNFLRYDDLVLPSDYSELSILYCEAKYFELFHLVDRLDEYSNSTLSQKLPQSSAMSSEVKTVISGRRKTKLR